MEELYNDVRESTNRNNISNQNRLARVMASLLQDAVNQQQVHDAAFEVSAAVSAHMCQYESVLATTMSKLLVATATHEIQAVADKRPPKPNAKVIKHAVKMKVVTEGAPKTIYGSHVKALISNAQKTITMQTMIDNGVPQPLAQQAAGDVYDPVVGAGAASDDIWGPVV
jgi:hypothetical protein